MKVLIAPLNWGLGHASRCIPLIHRMIEAGDEVVIAGDGESLLLLKKHFPTLRALYLAPLTLRYSKRDSQVWAILWSLPRLLFFSIGDARRLRRILRDESFDRVLSDNRFGLYNKHVDCIYMTHQLYIRLPRGWQWLEKAASRVHACIYNRYKEVWVPDYEDEPLSLSGSMSHPKVNEKVRYIGPLSRFESVHVEADTRYDVVAVLSGPEPQRTMLEKEIERRYHESDERVLIVRGKMREPMMTMNYKHMTRVPYMADDKLAAYLLGAKRIIARSGYSTIMDLACLGVLEKAELHATPGQPEQELLMEIHNTNKEKE